ncbi:MAG: threonylcarbamoyl-AMP synthase [Firmicutes bacterium]|nr:threonylcarbamoyl-AMP synthase [Bacillota bacterium]
MWQVSAAPGADSENLKESTPILQAAQVLRRGGLVAFPTETVYGLGANGLDAGAVAHIFTAKGRPADNPLILHIAAMETIHQIVAEVPALALRLAQTFWPGPLTLVLPKAAEVPAVTTGGLDTVAVRMPSHPVALALIEAAGVPVAAPSANQSGRPSPTEAAHVIADLLGRVDIILDGGPTGIGVESTVLDCTQVRPVILRPGGISREDLEQVVGVVDIDPEVLTGETVEDGPVRSPGMKYKHYAPQAPAVLVEGKPPHLFQRLAQLATELEGQGEQVGLMVSSELLQYWAAQAIDSSRWQITCMGSRALPEEIAANLYRCLRALDKTHTTKILIEGVPTTGLGLAIMNRLEKAAAHRILEV